MVTESTRNLVWQELLNSARLVRYYETLSDRFILKKQVLDFLLLISAVASVVTTLSILPLWSQALSGGAIAILVVYGFVSNYSKKAAVLHAISMECSYLYSQLELLWVGVQENTLSEQEALRHYRQIDERLTSVTGWAAHTDIKEDTKLNEQCESRAYAFIRNKYYLAG